MAIRVATRHGGDLDISRQGIILVASGARMAEPHGLVLCDNVSGGPAGGDLSMIEEQHPAS
jgi:hypothetical protein